MTIRTGYRDKSERHYSACRARSSAASASEPLPSARMILSASVTEYGQLLHPLCEHENHAARPGIRRAWQVDGDDASRHAVGLECHLPVIVESHQHGHKTDSRFPRFAEGSRPVLSQRRSRETIPAGPGPSWSALAGRWPGALSGPPEDRPAPPPGLPRYRAPSRRASSAMPSRGPSATASDRSMLKTLPSTKTARNPGMRKTAPPTTVALTAAMIDEFLSAISTCLSLISAIGSCGDLPGPRPRRHSPSPLGQAERSQVLDLTPGLDLPGASGPV